MRHTAMRCGSCLFLTLCAAACSQSGSSSDPQNGADGSPAGSSDASFTDAEPEGAKTMAECLDGVFTNPPPPGGELDYDQFGPKIGSHCNGTNHQDIQGVERVVFLGDSVTVGTPPTNAKDFYRARLADALAQKFNLDGPDGLWKQADLIGGTSLVQTSGDFASCAKYGARNDDLLRDNDQLLECFPDAERNKRTLVIITSGGNDIAQLTKKGIDGAPIDELWDSFHEFVDLFREAVLWLKEPGRFPNGVYVVYGNMFEFTDGTGDVESCPGASAAGFGGEWADKEAQAEMVIWANEQYVDIAVETGTDVTFLLESFCGHGYHNDDTSAPCYRGPDMARWFDATCVHPNPTGHKALTDIFLSVIEE